MFRGVRVQGTRMRANIWRRSKFLCCQPNTYWRKKNSITFWFFWNTWWWNLLASLAAPLSSVACKYAKALALREWISKETDCGFQKLRWNRTREKKKEKKIKMWWIRSRLPKLVGEKDVLKVRVKDRGETMRHARSPLLHALLEITDMMFHFLKRFQEKTRVLRDRYPYFVASHTQVQTSCRVSHCECWTGQSNSVCVARQLPGPQTVLRLILRPLQCTT